MWMTVVVAVAAITGLALAAGLLLSLANRLLPASNDSLVARIDELLPQTQCAQLRLCRMQALRGRNR